MKAIRPARGSRIRRAVQVVATVINEDRAFRMAVRRMPRPVPWDWARPRVLPLLAGPYLDADDDPPVRSMSEVGCAVVYGLEVGEAFPLVDVRVAESVGRSCWIHSFSLTGVCTGSPTATKMTGRTLAHHDAQVLDFMMCQHGLLSPWTTMSPPGWSMKCDGPEGH
jgi:hypothetical protein